MYRLLIYIKKFPSGNTENSQEVTCANLQEVTCANSQEVTCANALERCDVLLGMAPRATSVPCLVHNVQNSTYCISKDHYSTYMFKNIDVDLPFSCTEYTQFYFCILFFTRGEMFIS
jgi:hypothetical protein